MKFSPQKFAKQNGFKLDKYYFDFAAAEKVVSFIEKFCTHAKGDLRGKKLKLEEWQKEDIIYPLFGFKNKSDNTRKYRTCYIELPRKNGKTTLIAGLSLYLLCADDEKGAEIFSAAGDREQAKIMHDIAKDMVFQNKTLASKLQPFQNSIVYSKNGSFYKAISSESRTKHGFNAHGILFDELHVQKDRELWDTLTTSVGSRKQPLVIAITTAGTDKQSICFQKHEYALNIKKGIFEDDTFLSVIYAAGEKDDIESEKTWKKANPGYGVTCNKQFFQDQIKKIKEDPSFENTFKRLHLNIWVDSFSSFIPDSIFIKSKGEEFTAESLQGSECYAGLDLASINDFTALSLLFFEDDIVKPLFYFWLPEERFLSRQKDLKDIAKWKKEGFLKVTQGNVIDYNIIIDDIIKLSKIYRITTLAYDPWGGDRVAANLYEAGINISKYTQNISNIAPPTKELHRLILKEKFHHNNNPVYRWMIGNSRIYTDANNNYKIHKGKSKENVDGPVSSVIALGQWMAENTATSSASIYDKGSYGV